MNIKSGKIHALLISMAIIGTSSSSNTSAADGWSTLGAMPAPAWNGNTLLFHGGQGTLAITPLSDDVVRVRYTTNSAFGRDHSYAVVTHDLGNPSVKADVQPASATLTTASLKVMVQYSPLRISFANAA